MTKFSIIITAGGSSFRYGKTNKLLEILGDKTVIEQTVSKFLEFENITEIIIPTNLAIIDILNDKFSDFSKIKIIEGGQNRQESVYKALKEVRNEYVLIHDGARPLIDKETIQAVMDNVIEKSAVSVMTKTTDTIKKVDERGKILETIDRTYLYNTQTPQAFKTDLIKDAHKKLVGKNFTDDSSMLEELEIDVYIVEGNYNNIKITTKTDLDFAKLYI